MVEAWSLRSYPVGPHEAWETRREAPAQSAHLVDTTMFYAPRSGGVKRYLTAKRAWLAKARPDVRHTLVVPGPFTRPAGPGLMHVGSVKIPFGSGYRWPTSVRKWTNELLALRPDLIEAGDPFGPGLAALEAGQALGVPVVGFAHGDPSAQAALHFGEWAEAPARKKLGEVLCRFDLVVAASRHIADRLAEAGVRDVAIQPLGVDVDTFHPRRRDRDAVRRELGLSPSTRLLVFAGRPAKEKNVEAIIEAAGLLGAPYHLLLISAGGTTEWREGNVTALPYVGEPRALARIMSSCDAFVHANDKEPFGLIVLEAMACGLPLVAPAAGGVAELVDGEVAQLAHRADGPGVAEAIEALFERDLEALGRSARNRAASRYSWDNVFEGMGSLYAGLSGLPAFSGRLAAAH
ncbi:MAG TPA: glycosyltransferase [Caulobacteraceae bacterium]|jgi:alpha-1,6-mannosyltransferase